MNIKWTSMLAAACLTLTSACAHTLNEAAAPAIEQPADAQIAAEEEPSFEDVFGLVIETERHNVQIDAALSGATAKAMSEDRMVRPEIYRVDYALRSGARNLIALRDGLCIDGIYVETTCSPIRLPEWVLKAPDVEGTPFSEYQARSLWLSETMQPYVVAGCAAGRQANGDEMFCAVE